MRKQLIGMSLSVTLSLGLCAPAFAADTQTTNATVSTAALSDGVLQFGELENCVRNGNSNVLSCTESLANLELNKDSRDATIRSLKTAQNALSDAIWSLSGSMSTSSLQSQQNTIEDQLESYEDENYLKTYKGSVLQITSSVNEIVKSTESLYFNILTMDFSMKTMQHNLDAMNRSIAVMNTRCKLGQASNEDLRALQDKYSDLKSQLAALATQSKTAKSSLQSLIGIKSDGNLKLAVPDAIDDAKIAAIDLKSDIAKGKDVSSSLYNYQKAVNDAKDDLDEISTSPALQHAYQQAVYTLSAAKTNFEVQATSLYQTLTENQRLYKVTATNLISAQKTYSISEKKYALGMLSKQDLLSAQDSLTTANEAVDQAALNLNSAYENYNWVRLGITAAQ